MTKLIIISKADQDKTLKEFMEELAYLCVENAFVKS